LNLKNIQTIFDKSWVDELVRYAQFRPIYDGQGKRNVIAANIAADLTLKDLKTPLIMPAWNLTHNEPVLFSTLDPNYAHVTLREACDATSAVPIYFPPVKIGDCYYVDGGVAANNPIFVAYSEAKHMFPNTPLRILSIGTGIEPTNDCWKGDNVADWGPIQWVSHGLVELLLNSPNDMLMYDMNHLFQSQEMDNSQLLRLDSLVPYITVDETDPHKIEALQAAARSTVQEKMPSIRLFFDL
jgi:patatin-like phospholipase/acyl hydrolase